MLELKFKSLKTKLILINCFITKDLPSIGIISLNAFKLVKSKLIIMRKI
jgi:hypothetical protein